MLLQVVLGCVGNRIAGELVAYGEKEVSERFNEVHGGYLERNCFGFLISISILQIFG